MNIKKKKLGWSLLGMNFYLAEESNVPYLL